MKTCDDKELKRLVTVNSFKSRSCLQFQVSEAVFSRVPEEVNKPDESFNKTATINVRDHPLQKKKKKSGGV